MAPLADATRNMATAGNKEWDRKQLQGDKNYLAAG
jgi:hypothetical protein